ncbi:MFS transporter [Patescibacteria group bacterium]
MKLFDYKNLKISKNLAWLYTGRVLLQAAFGVIGLFLPIFFFTKFDNSFTAVLIIYAINFGLVLFLYPIASRILNSFSLKKMMIIAVPFALISIFSLYFWDYNPYLILVIFTLAIIIYKLLYWLPYHVDFAKFTDEDIRGRQISLLRNIAQIIGTIMPFVGGALIAYFTFSGAFLVSAFLFLFSIIPAFFIESTREHYSWGYLETFKKLFHKENRGMFIAFTADGFQSIVSAIIWPIFIFMLFDEKYLTVGIVSSLTIFAIIIIRTFIGNLLDTWNQKRMVVIGSIFNTTGWIVKLFIETAFQVFIADTYHNVGRVIHRTSVDTTQYDQAADNGHYVDEYTVLREMSLNIGRILMIGIAFIISFFFSIKFIFIFAAVATLFVTLINEQHDMAH